MIESCMSYEYTCTGGLDLSLRVRSELAGAHKSIKWHTPNDSSIVNRTTRTRRTWSFETDTKPNSNGPPRNGQDPGLTTD